MKIYTEMSLRNFEPWSGGEITYDRIYNAGMLDELESYLESEYPDGMDETELNDLFRFDEDWLFSILGIDDDEDDDDDDEDDDDEEA